MENEVTALRPFGEMTVVSSLKAASFHGVGIEAYGSLFSPTGPGPRMLPNLHIRQDVQWQETQLKLAGPRVYFISKFPNTTDTDVAAFRAPEISPRNRPFACSCL